MITPCMSPPLFRSRDDLHFTTWSSGNASINDDVEWGFAMGKRRHSPNLILRFLLSSLFSHSAHIALFNNLRYHDRYVGLILSIRLHWLVSGSLTRNYTFIVASIHPLHETSALKADH
jgi:hypothetical protein